MNQGGRKKLNQPQQNKNHRSTHYIKSKQHLSGTTNTPCTGRRDQGGRHPVEPGRSWTGVEGGEDGGAENGAGGGGDHHLAGGEVAVARGRHEANLMVGVALAAAILQAAPKCKQNIRTKT